MLAIQQHLTQNQIDGKLLQQAEAMLNSKGLYALQKEVFVEMLVYLEHNEPFTNLIPLLTDGQNNFICVFGKGMMHQKIMVLDHGEPVLSPKFKDLTAFLAFVATQTDAGFMFDPFNAAFDYPKTAQSTTTPEDTASLAKLWQHFTAETEAYARCQYAYAIANLTPFDDYSSLEPLLEEADFYIQEYVIEVFNHSRYQKAKSKIAQIAHQNITNASTAAKRFLASI